MRESRRRKLTNRMSSASASAVQYHGLRFSVVNRSTSGRSILSTGLMPGAAVGEVEVADAEDALVGVDGDAADDLAERERHDRDVVAAQAQRREAEQRAGERGEERRYRQDQQPVQVDARLRLQELGDADVDVGGAEEARAEPAHRVRADREERDVAEVEQAGEADHDVQPERHDDVDQRGGRVLDERAAGVVEERQQDREHDRRHPRRRCRAGNRPTLRGSLMPRGRVALAVLIRPPSSARRAGPAAGTRGSARGSRTRWPASTPCRSGCRRSAGCSR